MGTTQPRRIEELVAREVVLALLLLAAALAQATLLPRLFGAVPNALLLLTICQSLLSGPANGARWGFYAGLGLDLLTDSAFGTHALALVAAALFATLWLAWLSRDNWLLPLIGTLLGSLAYHAVLALLTSLLVAPVSLRTYMWLVIAPATILIVVPALPLFLLLRWAERRRRGEVPIDVY